MQSRVNMACFLEHFVWFLIAVQTQALLRLSCTTLAFFNPLSLSFIHFRYLFFSFSEATRGSAVKRFSISFARHPTNGMFAYVHSQYIQFLSFSGSSINRRAVNMTFINLRQLKIPIQHTRNQFMSPLQGGLFTWIAVCFLPSSVKRAYFAVT